MAADTLVPCIAMSLVAILSNGWNVVTLVFSGDEHAVFHCWGVISLLWRHNGCDGVSNHQPHHSLLNRLFMSRSKKTSKLRVTGLCEGNSPVTGEFPAQRASNAENVSIWWRHHIMYIYFRSPQHNPVWQGLKWRPAWQLSARRGNNSDARLDCNCEQTHNVDM